LVPWRRSKDFGLIVGRATADVNDEPDVAEPQECRFALAQHRGAEDVTVKAIDRWMSRTMSVLVTTNFSPALESNWDIMIASSAK